MAGPQPCQFALSCRRAHECKLALNPQRTRSCLLRPLSSLYRSLGAALGDSLQLRPAGAGGAAAALVKAGSQAAP